MQYNLTKKYGAQVATAESVAEALLKLQAGDLYNLILLDIKMPRVSGVDAYPTISSYSRGAKIVLMSAYAKSDDWNRAKEMEVLLVSKPIPEEVLERLLLETAEDMNG